MQTDEKIFFKKVIEELFDDYNIELKEKKKIKKIYFKVITNS